MTEYDYTKSPVALDRLTQEITTSAIITALDHLAVTGDALSVFFKADLSDGDKTLLDGIVTAHTGTPLVVVLPPRAVITAAEVNDKTLKLATGLGNFDATTHLAVCEVKVPGTFAGFDYTSDGRFVAGGYAFQDQGKFGDRVIKIEVVDKDNLIGYGVGTVIKTYHDQDVDEANAGWYMYPAPQAAWEIEIDPIGGYGKLPAGLYLRITFLKCTDSPATQVATNIWWGKLE